jgi:hypothetical protein
VPARERAKRRNGEIGSAEKDEPQASAGLYEVECGDRLQPVRGRLKPALTLAYGGAARCVPVAAVDVVCVACWLSVVGA